jgi:hypothetical protein
VIPKITEDIVDRNIPGSPGFISAMSEQRGPKSSGRGLFRMYEDKERAKRGDIYKGQIVKGAV